MNYFMKCGCSSSGCFDTKTKKPVCSIHDCEEIIKRPNLEGRQAKCVYGQHEIVDSDIKLYYFRYLPNKTYDEYYCGCFGYE